MESAAQDEDGSVGFDFQILHQAGSGGEIPLLAKCAMSGAAGTPLSQTEGDEYHLGADAFRGNMMAWRS
jgi:hypothetical protein